MDFHTMKRKELQALCKNHKIPANLTNLEMANRLASLLKVDKEKPQKQRVNSVKSCLKILDDLGDVDEKSSEDKLAKKVRFSPEDQTFEFEKTNPREMRLARRKSVVITEDKIKTGEKVAERVDVDNQVTSVRTRGRGRKPEQADVVEAKLSPKKKGEEIDGSKKASRKRTSVVAHCELQPLVDAHRHKETKNTASEATKPVTRRSVRIVERPDESASVIEQVEIDKLPKRKTRSDWPENQEMEKAPTRCLRRNISKDACTKAVEELKEQGNGTSRVTRKTRQQKGDIGLNETVSAAESAPVEKASTRAEELKEQGNEKAKVMRKTRQQKGDIGLNETVSAAESAPVEKASTRAEELKEQGNEKAKVMCKTRQQKGDIVLNETVSAAESASVEKPSTRAEALNEQGSEKTKVTRKTRQQKGDIGLNETISATESATVVDKASTRCLRRNTSKDAGGKAAEEAKELGNKKGRATPTTRLQGQQRRSTRVAIKRCSLAPGELNGKNSDADVQQRGVTLKSKESRKQENSSHPGKSDEQTRCADKRKLSTKKHGEGLRTDLEVAPLAVNSEISSVCEAGDIQNRLCNESSALEDNQDNDKSLHQTTPTPLLKERELTNAEAKAELINESSTKKNAPAKQPENAVFSSNQKGVLLELYSSDGQLTEGDEDEPDIDKEEERKEAVILDGISLDDAEVVLLPSIGFQASSCGTTSTVSRSFTEGSKKELENTVSRADYCDKIDPALTSTSTDTFTGISLPECESGSQGIYQPQLETAIPSSLIVESDADISNSVEGSPAKNTELEEHTLCAENQSGDALEECNALDFYNLECQISKDESTVHDLGLESYPSLLESQSWTDKPAAVLETSTLASIEPVNAQADTCIDRLGAHESGKNTGQEESEGVTPTPMVDERSEGIDTYISDGSDDPVECKRSHKQGLEEESDSPTTIHEQTYDIASLFQLDSAEQDSVVIRNGLEGKNITEVSDVQLNDDHENDAVLADRYLEVYMEKAGKNEVYYQEAEGVSPTATVHELSEGIDTCSTDRSYDLAEFEKSHKQGLKEESTSQMAIHQETNGMIASFFQLEGAERDSEETYDIALLFQLENAERDRVVTSNDLEESKVEEVSDAQLNDNHEDEIFADKKLEVNEEEGKSCSEIHEISGIVNESAVSLEEAICVGSTTMVHKVSSPRSYYNNKLELVGGLKKHEELTCMDYNDKLPAQRSSMSFEEDAFMDEARESDPQYLTEMYSGCTDEKMHTLQQVTTELISMHVTTELISMHGSGHMDDSESDSEISSEDKSSEEKGATVIPNDCLLMPYDLDHLDANNNYEITQEVSREVACPLEEYMVVASEATQDGVTPNSYSPKPNPAGLSHPMHQKEYENNYKNEAAPNVLEGSEEKLFSPSSVEEANTIDEYIESDDSRATVDAIAPSPEAVCPVDELYSIKNIEPEEDFLGLAILERISEQTGEQGSSEISGDSELHDTDDDKEFKQNVSCTLEPEEADNKVYKEAQIHNGYSSEDSENVLLCSGRVKGSPPKESEGWTSMEKVDEIFGSFVGDSFTSDRIDDYAGSEGSHKQGLTKESNLELSVHEDVHCCNLEEASTERPVLVHESSDNEDIELTSYETALFMGDSNISDKTGTLEYWTSETSLLTSTIDGGEKKEEKIAMEEVAGDGIYQQGFQSSEYTLLASVVCDKDESMQQKYAFPNGDFLEPEQRKIFEVVTGIIDRVSEDENAPTDEANKDVSVGLMKQDEGLVGETLEGDHGRIEPPVTASFPEMSSITPDDESKNADVKGISDAYVFQGSGQKPLIRSVVDDNPTAVNLEIDALGGSAQLLTQLPEPSNPVEEMDATNNICVAEDVHIHENREKEFELTDLETDNDTSFGCGADELNHTTSETGFTILSSLFCASKLLEEAAVPNSHSMGMCQVELEVGEIVDQGTAFEGNTLAVYNEELSQVGHEDTILPEHSKTSELVIGTCEHMREDEAPLVNLEFCIGETEVQPCVPHLEMHGTMIDDQYKSENIEGISKDDEIMPQQEMKPLKDKITADVCDKDMSKVEHEDTSIPEHSRTPELVTGTFEHLENDNASAIQPISDMLEELKEDEEPGSSEEEIKSTGKNLECSNGELEVQACELHQESSTAIIYDPYKYENVEGISKDEIMPQQEMKPLDDEVPPDVYDKDLSKLEHEDTSIPEHSRTSELVSRTFEHLEDDNASVIQPMSDMLEDLKEDEVPGSSEEEIKSTDKILEFSNRELEVQPYGLHPEMNTTMIDDHYKSENVEGISREDEIMPQQEMKPLNDEITPDVYDEDLSKVEHEDPNLPEHSRTSELVTGAFEHLEDGNASVIQPMSDMLGDLEEDAVPVSSEVLPCELHPEMNTTMIDDQYKSENIEGTSKEDEIMPQQEMKPLNDEIRDAKHDKVEKSSKKPASATNQKKRSILIHGTPRRPIKIADMKENSTAQLKRDRLANATASKPLAGRKALGELSRWRP